MKLHALLALALTLSASAAPKKPAPAKAMQAQPAQPAALGKSAKPSTLITSDMGGRDIAFITQAMELGKGLTFLAQRTARTTNPRLQSYGTELLQTLAAQDAVLTSAAEMRNVKPPAESALQQKYAEKFASLEGAKLEKTLLGSFIELEQSTLATYEANAKSADLTIAKFIAEELPKSREHLATAQSMMGISPKRPTQTPTPAPAPEAATKAEPEPPKPTPPARPVFRTTVTLPI